jgi:ABC-type nitrate/sulfonate/bicarbonate transport system substrate-binding protein
LRYQKKDDPLTFCRWIITGFLFSIVFRPPALWSADGQRLEKLVIGYPAPVASLGIIDVMRKASLFKKYGLDVDLVYIQGSPILTAAMVSGQVPLSFLGGAAIVASAVGGADTVTADFAQNRDTEVLNATYTR